MNFSNYTLNRQIQLLDFHTYIYPGNPWNNSCIMQLRTYTE